MIKIELNGQSFELKTGDKLKLKDLSIVTFEGELVDRANGIITPIVIDQNKETRNIMISDIIEVIQEIERNIGLITKILTFFLNMFRKN